MIYVEMMSPHGHIRLNNFYLAKLWREGDLLVIGQALASEYRDFKIETVPDFLKGKFNRLRLAIAVLKILSRASDKRICFLSYDLMMMPLISAYLRLKKWEIFLFEHNTAPVSFMKRVFQRCIGRGIIRFAYADYIARLFSDIHLAAHVISCPILTTDIKSNSDSEIPDIKIAAARYSTIVFCPSGSAEFDGVERVATLNPDKLFVVKTSGRVSAENIFSSSSFADYLGIMRLADLVYIPFPREDKISGPFFEAIGCNKTIVVKRNKFGVYAKQSFPEYVLFDDEPWRNLPNSSTYDVMHHNEKIISDLSAIFGYERSSFDLKSV